MIGSKIIWLSVMASVALVASMPAENALASILTDRLADIDEEEATTTENSSIATGANETVSGNMTGVTNSTS